MPARSIVTAVACAVMAVATPASAQDPPAPRIDAATPLVELPGEICVCGRFPTPEAARALRIGGRPLEIVGPVHERVLTARLPPGLAPGLQTLTGAPEAGYGPDEEAAIRVVAVNSKVCRRPFQRRRVHFVIAGTEEPVSLTVRNLTPDQVRVAGGTVQQVTTAGGRSNQKVLGVRVLRSGPWSLHATLDAPACPCAGADDDGVDPERRDELARGLADSLAEVEGWFDARAAEARAAAPGSVPASEAREILDRLEDRLLKATAAPELAALRAWVLERLDEERRRWATGPAPAAPVPAPRPAGLTLAGHPAVTARQGPSGSQSDFDGLVGRVRALFADLRRVSRDLVVDLCVRSLPSRAEVWVQPKRYAPGRRIELTDTAFENLTRGVYAGRVERPGHRPEDFEVDLVSEIGIYVLCNLEEGWCDQPPEPPAFSCREPRTGGE